MTTDKIQDLHETTLAGISMTIHNSAVQHRIVEVLDTLMNEIHKRDSMIRERDLIIDRWINN